MKQQIDAILEPFRRKGMEAGCEFDGTFWQVWIASHAGARQDGIGLAAELAARVRGTPSEPEAGQGNAEAVQVVREVPTPDPAQAAKIAELEARLAEAEAALEEAHAPQPIQPDGPIPDELADLISYADTPAQTSEKLLVRLREVLGLIGLAEDAGGRAAPELYRKRDRLESGIQWNRGRLAETI